MASSALPGFMEHDGHNTAFPNNPMPSSFPTVRSFTSDAGPSDATTSASTSIPSASGRTGPLPYGTSPTSRGRSNSRTGTGRIFCPVVGCPESLSSSNRHFRDFNSIKTHLNDHCTGQLSGAIPSDFLRHHDYTQCRLCDRVLHNRYNSICKKCRPKERSQGPLNNFQTHGNTADNTPLSDQQQHVNNTQRGLPTLAAIHELYVPTRKNVPKALRGLYAQCLKKAIAQTVLNNNETSWSELQMLTKCTLCVPPRGGKAHLSQRVSWTRSRLLRWIAGERAELWFDLPQYKRPKPRKFSNVAANIQRQERCIALTSEGGYSNACKALVSHPPLAHTAEVTGLLKQKHPVSDRNVDLSSFGPSSSSLVPLADTDLVSKCIRSFHRLSGGGPSGLCPIHLKNCLTTVHRDEILEQICALLNILAKGEAPSVLSPFLAGATLTALPKKDDGIRPVAVGDVWRRLTAKFLCNSYKEQASSYFFHYK